MSSSGKLDVSQCEAMAELVENLTTTGKPVLDEGSMKAFKKICKRSDEYVKHAYHLLITQLEKQHSEIRLSCLLMFDELFQRSHCFREQLLADFQYFLILVAETETDTPLPPPKPAAKSLKMKSLVTIQAWHEKFSGTYKKLALGYNYLQHCKKVDFNDIRARNVAERRREDELKRKQEQQRKEKLENTTKELKDGKVEIESVITQLENCIQLLLPDLVTFSLHGLASPEYRPNYNPFRIPSRRVSSTEASTSKSPVYGPVASGSVDTDSKLGSPKPRIGSRRKSSTIPCELSPTNSQESNKSRRSSGAKSRTPSPTKLSSPKRISSGKREVTIKQEPVENFIEHTVDSDSRIENQSFTSTTVKQELASGKSCKRGRRKSSAKTPSEIEANQFRNDKHPGNVEAPVKTERSESIDDSEAEDNMEEMSDDEEDYFHHSQFVRESGLGSQHYSISININPDNEVQITETADNSDIIHNMNDLNRELVNKWLPAVVKWLEILTKNGAEKSDILKAIDLKRHIIKVKEKTSKIKTIRSAKRVIDKPSVSIESKEDSDSDFEEVPEKEGYEPRIPDHLREEYGLVNKPPKPSTSKDWKLEETVAEYNDVSDPSSAQATVKELTEKIKRSQDSPAAKALKREPSTMDSPKSKRKSKDPNIPSVPFGTDLLHWGDEDVALPLLVRYESDLKGWVPTREEEDRVDVNALESRKSRVINFEGEFVPVKWKCRAPLTGGKLCERMDRQKCPFHGKVIARDEQGKPTDPDDIRRLAEQELDKTKGKDSTDWEDTELQADIQAQTGVQLLREKKGRGKGRPKKYPGLTDLKKTSDSCRTRLQNKVLSKGALKRVAESMDRNRDRKIQDKFGNNFTYAVPRR